VTPPGTSNLTIGNTTGQPFATSTITVTGTSSPSAIVHSTQVSLTLYPGNPAAPVLAAPADGAVGTTRSPTLDWSDIAQATGYHVDVATDAGFTNIVRTADVTASEWKVAPQLGILTQYFWRVSASNPCGSTPGAGAFSFTTANPAVLLVDDDDDDPDVFATYQVVLDSLVVYDIWDVVDQAGEPTLADLEPYRAVIWFSGDRFTNDVEPSAGPQTPAENALATYLGFGRCVLISSQDYLWDMGGSGHNTPTPFMTQYLGVASGSSDIGDYTAVDGQNLYAALQDQVLAFPYFDFSDILTPGAGALIAFRGDTPNTNTGAVSKQTELYLTTYAGFGIEAFPAATQDDVLNTFISACLASDVLFADGFETGNIARWSLSFP
jgi:hypothetical protein